MYIANRYAFGDRNSYLYSNSYGYLNADANGYTCVHSQPNIDTYTNTYADRDASGW